MRKMDLKGAHLALPSTVEDVDFVCMPPEEEVAATCDNWEECGKWILSDPDADLEFSDRAWKVLRPLLTDGTLLMLKASTARLGDEGSIVQCFTRPGEEEIRTAAEKIREVVDAYMGIMYYKQNQQTQARVGRRYGHKNISVYMYTHMGRLYRRDRINSWILNSINRDQRDCSIPCRFYRENYAESEELPSRSPRRSAHFPLTHSGSAERLANWFLKCSCSDSNAVYLPDVDRVWIVAKELFEEGSFAKLFWSKRDNVAEIRMFVPRVRDVRHTLALCDRIFEEASVRNPIFYTTGEEKKIRYSYKYTAEGELYEQTSFAEKFVLQREA